jgi:hypothetical protein
VFRDLKEYRDQLDFRDDRAFKVLLVLKVPKALQSLVYKDLKEYKVQ